jgi:hypothetical protein
MLNPGSSATADNRQMAAAMWWCVQQTSPIVLFYLLMQDEEERLGVDVVSYFTCGLWMLHLGSARHVMSDFPVDLRGALNLESLLIS